MSIRPVLQIWSPAMMNEGTKNKTPEQLEDAIGLLGATIRVSASNENISIDVSTLSRNFEKTLSLVEEMLLEPRWDEEQFGLVSSRIPNSIKRNAASPDYLSSSTLNKLMFGDNILSTDLMGTVSSVSSITITDLKDFYSKYFSPSIARFLVAGDVDRQRVQTALSSLSQKWPAKVVSLSEIKVPAAPEKSQIYFVDVPGCKTIGNFYWCPIYYQGQILISFPRLWQTISLGQERHRLQDYGCRSSGNRRVLHMVPTPRSTDTGIMAILLPHRGYGPTPRLSL